MTFRQKICHSASWVGGNSGISVLLSNTRRYPRTTTRIVKRGPERNKTGEREMAISGDLRVSATLGSYPSLTNRSSFASTKVDFSGFLSGSSGISCNTPKWSSITLDGHSSRCHSKKLGEYKLSPSPFSQETESFLLNVVNMKFLERLNLAWKIIFPTPTIKRNSNAKIAKQRLKMILFSDRCAVSDEAKQKIVTNIVKALSDFVVIESQDKVQLSVSTDTDLGTIYSVTVPVRRVRPEYQIEDETGMITNVEYKDTGDTSGSVDVTFDFFVPDEDANGYGF